MKQYQVSNKKSALVLSFSLVYIFKVILNSRVTYGKGYHLVENSWSLFFSNLDENLSVNNMLSDKHLILMIQSGGDKSNKALKWIVKESGWPEELYQFIRIRRVR